MVHKSQVPRSCDRCHASKERCSRPTATSKCERCNRLNFTCTLERHAKRPGRPLMSAAARRSRAVAQLVPPTAVPSPALLATVDAISKHKDVDISASAAKLIACLCDDNIMGRYIIGPSFYEAHRQYLVSTLCASPYVLADAYLAGAACQYDDHYPPPAGLSNNHSQKEEYTFASSAVATLRNFTVRTVDDMRDCLVLGGHVVTFALRLQAVDSRSICQRTLDLIKPVYEDDDIMRSVDPALTGFLTSLILTDIAESLFCCQPPALRYRHSWTNSSADRYLGISSSLLGLLHDLATLSFEMSLDREHARASPKHQASIITLESNISKWEPEIPPGFMTQYTPTEISHMICQAEVLRTSAQLILHHLRHPFRRQDPVAEALSMQILNMLTTTKSATQSVPRCTDMPLTIACLQYAGQPRADKMAQLSPISEYSDIFLERFTVMLTGFNRAWSPSSEIYWYDLGRIFPPSQ